MNGRSFTHRTTPALAGVFLGAVLLLLGGCATPQLDALETRWPAGLPPRAELSQVPFYAQEEYQCGPAALAMALTHAGLPTSPEDLTPQVFLPGREGSLQADMLAATRRRGWPAYVITPQIEALLREVAAGHAVVVLLNLGLEWIPVWHYAVVIGYDRDRALVLMHSGPTARDEMALATFERTWARSGRWAMLALPPRRLPATATAPDYAAAVAVLERVDPRAAQRAYATALRRWPRDATLWLGSGNTAYALKQPDRAARAYRAATGADPASADAWNNLAQVLHEQRRRAEAEAAIARAVALGGPRLPQYLQLQAEIRGN